MSKKSKKAADTKGKKKTKDLKVSKETVQGLSDEELGNVQGGAVLPKSRIGCVPIPISRSGCEETLMVCKPPPLL